MGGSASKQHDQQGAIGFSALLNLPTSLLVEILSVWLGVYDISTTDAAFCSKRMRPDWLELISLKELIMSDHGCNWMTDEAISSFMRWCVRRNLRVNEIAFDGSVSPSDAEPFFEAVGPSLKYLSFCGAEAYDTSLAMSGMFCTKLVRAELGYCGTENNIPQFLLSTSATLVELFLRRCDVEIPEGVVIPPFPSLRLLAVDEALDARSATALISACTDLRDIRLSLVDYLDAVLPVIAAKHTALEALCICECAGVPPAGLIATVEQLPALTTVEFYYPPPTLVNDETLTALTRHCPKLTAICLEACEDVTDRGLTVLQEHCATRLTHLTLTECPAASLTAVEALVARCPHLVDLSLGYFENVISDETGQTVNTLATVLNKAPTHLQALSISAMSEDAAAFAAMAARCSELVYLCLFDLSPAFDKRHVAAILEAAPKLQVLCVSLVDLNITDADCEQWTRLRPGLVVTEELDRSPFWEEYVYPSFPPDDEAEEEESEDFGVEGEDEDSELDDDSEDGDFGLDSDDD